MATIKEKLQSLIDKANITTNKSDTDITEAVKSLVSGYGQGSCTGNHVFEVEALPTEGVSGNLYKIDDLVLNDIWLTNLLGEEAVPLMLLINILLSDSGIYFSIVHINSQDELPKTDALSPVYFVKSECMAYVHIDATDEDGNLVWTAIPDGYSEGDVMISYDFAHTASYYEWVSKDYRDAFRDVIFIADNYRMSLSWLAIMAEGSLEYSLNIIPTPTTEDIKPSVGTGDSASMHVYYIEDENDLFVYIDMDGSGTNKWISLTEIIRSEHQTEMPFKGFVVHAGEAASTGIYAVGGALGWKQYFRPSGTLYATASNKYIDVTNYSRAYLATNEYTGEVVYE